MEDKKSTEKTKQQYDIPVAQIMRRLPEVFTDMLRVNAEGAFFKQTTIKQVELRPDSILCLPNEGLMFIVEFQARYDAKILDKAFVEATVHRYQMTDEEKSKYPTVGALVLFTTSNIIPKNSDHKSKYNQGENPQFRSICLEDFEDSKDYKWGSLILALCEKEPLVIEKKVPGLWKNIERLKDEGKIDIQKYEYLKETMQLILISNPNIKNIKEVNKIMGFALNLDTPVFHQIIQEGMEKGMEKGTLLTGRKFILTLIRNKFGKVPPEVESYVSQVTNGDLDHYFNMVSFSGNLEELVEKTKNLV